MFHLKSFFKRHSDSINSSQTSKYHEGRAEDYEVEQKPDGYYITRFVGFEPEYMSIPGRIDGKTIKGIAKNAFKGCVSVKGIRVSEGIEIIENGAFCECKALEDISLPNTLRKIGSEEVFYGNGVFAQTNLKSIVIPESVDFLGAYSFYRCFNLRTARLSNKINCIHERTFSNCIFLEDVKLPTHLETIKEEAFENCKSLRELHIPLGTQAIEYRAFYGTNLSAIYIPPTVTKISSEATFYYSRKNLTIYCAAGSAAMDYARNNGIKCEKAQF